MTTSTAAAATDITTAELITAVRTHAIAHYEDGWDIIVEATTDAELAKLIGVVRTAKAAIAKVAKFVALKAEQRAAIDAQVTGKAAAKTTTPKPAAEPKQAYAGNMAVIGRKAPDSAPAAAITITGLTDVGLNLLYLLATSGEPVSGASLSPAVAYSLQSLAKRGVAQLAPHDGTDKRYTLTERGAALVTLMWDAPEAKPAAKPAPAGKPAARKTTTAASTAK